MQPPAGPDFDQRYRLSARALHRTQTAVGAHEKRLAGKAAIAQCLLDGGQKACEDGTHIGIRRSGRGALVFIPFRTHLGAGGDINAGQQFPKLFGDRSLVGRVDIRIHKGNRDGFGFHIPKRLRQSFDFRWIDRFQDRAVRANALVKFEAEVARNQRWIALIPEVERRRPISAT